MRASWSYCCFPCGYKRTVTRVLRAYACASTTGPRALPLGLSPDCPDTLCPNAGRSCTRAHAPPSPACPACPAGPACPACPACRARLAPQPVWSALPAWSAQPAWSAPLGPAHEETEALLEGNHLLYAADHDAVEIPRVHGVHGWAHHCRTLLRREQVQGLAGLQVSWITAWLAGYPTGGPRHWLTQLAIIIIRRRRQTILVM